MTSDIKTNMVGGIHDGFDQGGMQHYGTNYPFAVAQMKCVNHTPHITNTLLHKMHVLT